MMVTTCIMVGLCLAVCGIVIACTTTKKDKHPKANTPPPLPPRATVNVPSPSVSRSRVRTRTRAVGTAPALPPRRPEPRTATAGALGPRGVRPDQFPCCPYDKQRNVVGAPQLIFWDGTSNCYRCSRGHRFKRNGKIFNERQRLYEKDL